MEQKAVATPKQAAVILTPTTTVKGRVSSLSVHNVNQSALKSSAEAMVAEVHAATAHKARSATLGSVKMATLAHRLAAQTAAHVGSSAVMPAEHVQEDTRATMDAIASVCLLSDNYTCAPCCLTGRCYQQPIQESHRRPPDRVLCPDRVGASFILLRDSTMIRFSSSSGLSELSATASVGEAPVGSPPLWRGRFEIQRLPIGAAGPIALFSPVRYRPRGIQRYVGPPVLASAANTSRRAIVPRHSRTRRCSVRICWLSGNSFGKSRRRRW